METTGPQAGLTESALDPSLVTSVIIALHDPKTEKQRIPELSRWLLEFRQLPNSLDVTLQLLKSPHLEVRFHAIGMIEYHLDKTIEAERAMATQQNTPVPASPLIVHLLDCFSIYIANKEKEVNLRKLGALIANYAGRLERLREMWIRVVVTKIIEPAATTVDLLNGSSGPLSPQIVGLMNPDSLYIVICFLNELGDALSNSLRAFREDPSTVADGQRALTALEPAMRDASNLIIRGLDSNDGIDTSLGEKIRTASAESVMRWTRIGQPQGDGDPPVSIRDDLVRALIVCISRGATPEACQYLQTIVGRMQYGTLPTVGNEVQVLLAHPTSIFRHMVAQAQLGDEDARPYFNLFLAVAEQSVPEMLRDAPSEFHTYLLDTMKQSILAPEWPVEPSHPAILALTFWQRFIDDMSDALMSADGEQDQSSALPWWPSARLHLLDAIEKFMVRLRLPSASELQDWSRDERDMFREFRRDVKDLFSEAYAIVGNDILVGFLQATATALEGGSPDPLHIEASLTSLAAIGDAINESDENDQAVATVVGNGVFPFLSGRNLPSLVKKSGIDLIASLTSFYQRRPDAVPLALNFLFDAVQHESLAVSASRSISQLTSACRSELTGELRTFFAKYDELATAPSTDTLTKEKLIGSLAAVVEAIPNPEDRLAALETLLRYVSQDVQRSIELMRVDSAAESLRHGEQAMRCLAAVAKSFEQEQAPVIDLERSNGDGRGSTSERERAMQVQIAQLISTQLSLYGDHATFEIVEAACCVFRTAFKRQGSSPFALSPDDFLALLFQRSVQSPGFAEEWLKSLCTYLSAVALEPSRRRDSDMNGILQYLLSIVMVQLQSDPGQDPDATVGVVQCLTKFMKGYLPAFCRLSIDCRPALHFAARALETREVLPRRAAAEFWKRFLDYVNNPPEIQTLLDTIFDEVHGQLAVALVSQVALHSSKSELTTFAEPIAKYMQRHRHASMWMEQAVHAVLAPLTNESAYRPAAERYIRTLQKARGSLAVVRKANLEFREACRGPGLTV